MDESAYTALYTGTYIFVFIIALSLTIFLFTEVVNYADVAYEFDEKIADNSVIMNAPYGENQLIDANEVAAYYFNYVDSDLTDTYNVKVYNSTAISDSYLIPKRITYQSLMNRLGASSNKKYILKLDGIDDNGIKNLIIRQANQSEINSLE